MPDGENALVTALNRLAALGTERDQEQIGALLDRLVARGCGSWSPVRPNGGRAR
jgi:hypothetical protein